MPEDIRDVPADQYWQHFETVWTGLLSYRYLGRRHGGIDRWDGRQTMALRHDMRNPAGGIMAAPLCIASPESGGMADDFYVPNPVIAFHAGGRRRPGRARDRGMRSETVHLGRQMGFSRTVIVDADRPRSGHRPLRGHGREPGQHARGFRAGGQPTHRRRRLAGPTAAARRLRLRPARRRLVAAGRAERRSGLARRRACTSGPSTCCSRRRPPTWRPRPPLPTSSRWRIGTSNFVARGKVGPFRTAGRAVVGNLGRVGVQLTLHDEGNGDRVITTGSASFRPVG